MSYKNLNKVFNDVAWEQGFEPGSLAWNEGGILPYSGTTGNHPAYGWNHTHKLSEQWVKQVVANYFHRRMFYVDGVVIPRKVAYENAGRPLDYKPIQPGDNLSGGVDYITSKGVVTVTGPDILHFHLGPLFALYDEADYHVIAQGNPVKASFLASVGIKMFMKSLAGQLMKSSNVMVGNSFGDRGAANIIEATNQAVKRGLVDYEDYTVLAKYIGLVLLPYYAGNFVHHDNPKDKLGLNPPVPDGMEFLQLYNGMFWLLPSLYDAMNIAPEGNTKEILTGIVQRWSQYLLDLEEIVPGKGVQMAGISIPDAIMKEPKPVPSLKPYLTEKNIHFGQTDWSQWGLKAQFVAAKVLNSDVLYKAANALVAKWKPKLTTDTKAWMVDADNQYVV